MHYLHLFITNYDSTVFHSTFRRSAIPFRQHHCNRQLLLEIIFITYSIFQPKIKNKNIITNNINDANTRITIFGSAFIKQTFFLVLNALNSLLFL